MRRFTRLTNGFSKKAENLCHAVSGAGEKGPGYAKCLTNGHVAVI